MLNFLLNKSMLLDGTLFTRDKVLTSREIQRRFQAGKQSAARKTPVTVDERFWILSPEETETFIQVRQTADNSGKNPDSSRKNPQSSRKNATKESKGKESKGNERKGCGAEESGGPEPAEWIAALPLSLPPNAQQQIANFLQLGASRGLVEWAVKEAAGRGKPWGYARAILQTKLEEGVTDVSQLPKRQRPQETRPTSYDGDEFDRRGLSLPDIEEVI